MSYKIELSEKSIKLLDKLKIKDNHNFQVIIQHLKLLEQQPEHSSKSLVGHLRGLWSCRAGNFRIIFQINKETNIVFVITIGNRRNVYE